MPASKFPFRSQRSTVVVFLAALGLSACNAGSSTHSYSAPRDPGPATFPSSASVDEVASRARAAGLTVTSTNRRTGIVTLRANGPALVDCGEFVQRIDGRRARIAGDAPMAVMINFDAPGDVMIREADVASTVTVRLPPGQSAATVRENHRVTIRHGSAASAQTFYRETKAFDENSRAGFREGSSCVSSGAMTRIVQG